MSLLLVLIAFAFMVVCAVFDITNTHRGLVKGLAVESNAFVVMLFGNKPSLFGLYFCDAVLWSLFAAFGALGIVYNNAALVGMSIGGSLACGGKHIMGGLKWRLLLQGKPLPTKSTMTAFQKFCGWFSYNW